MGKLRKLCALTLQYNQLNSTIHASFFFVRTIHASLGELETLTRLDLGCNSLIGPIPVRLAMHLSLRVYIEGRIINLRFGNANCDCLSTSVLCL